MSLEAHISLVLPPEYRVLKNERIAKHLHLIFGVSAVELAGMFAFAPTLFAHHSSFNISRALSRLPVG